MSRKAAFEGFDIDRFQEEKELLADLQSILREIAGRYDKKCYCQPVVQRAIDALTVTTFDDGILSLGSARKKFRARQPNKLYTNYHILLCTIYGIVELWWKYRQQKIEAGRIERCLNYLDYVVGNGIENCKVRGNVRIGWRLK